MRRLLCSILILALAVTFAGTVFAAGTIKQVVLPDKSTILVTAVDKLATDELEGFRHEMIMYTPAYKGTIAVPGLAAAVAAVSNGKITDIRVGTVDDTLPTAPPISANGFVLYGSGRGYAALAELAVGDAISIVDMPSVKPDKLPTKVVADTGDSIDITGFDIGRGAGELIVYTNDWGSKTWTNEWGTEAAVLNGEVIAVRAFTDTEPFDIPKGAWVVSGHDAGSNFVTSYLTEGSTVTFE